MQPTVGPLIEDLNWLLSQYSLMAAQPACQFLFDTFLMVFHGRLFSASAHTAAGLLHIPDLFAHSVLQPLLFPRFRGCD